MSPASAAEAARSQALDDLRRASLALAPHLQTAGQREDLALIEAAIARLAVVAIAPDIAEFEPARLDHLLTLTGPDLAQELLARLTEDLAAALATLEQASATDDWKRLREATHVLISLSGSVGALSLQAMAEALNAQSHAQDRPAAQALLPTLLKELRALISYVSSTRKSGLP